MTVAEMNKRIAELEGWTDVEYHTPHTDAWHEIAGDPVQSFYRGKPDNSGIWMEIPHYTQSLDRIVSAILKIVPASLRMDFSALLATELKCDEEYCVDAAFNLVTAPPWHLAKVLLQTMGKWND